MDRFPAVLGRGIGQVGSSKCGVCVQAMASSAHAAAAAAATASSPALPPRSPHVNEPPIHPRTTNAIFDQALQHRRGWSTSGSIHLWIRIPSTFAVCRDRKEPAKRRHADKRDLERESLQQRRPSALGWHIQDVQDCPLKGVLWRSAVPSVGQEAEWVTRRTLAADRGV